MQNATPVEAPRDSKRIYIDNNPDGSMTFSKNGEVIAQPLQPALQAKVDKASRSANQARLDALETGAPALVKVASPVDPLPWWVGALDLEGVTRVGVWAGRNRDATLALHEKGKFTGLLAAMLFVAVRNEDGTDYFPAFEDAHDQASRTSAAAVELNADLFAAILALNPGVLPEARAGEEKKTGNLTTSSTGGQTDGSPKTAYLPSPAGAQTRKSRRKRSTKQGR